MRTCTNRVQRDPARRRTDHVMQIHGELSSIDAWQREAECLQSRDAAWAYSAQLRSERARSGKKCWRLCASKLNGPGGHQWSYTNRRSACSWMRDDWTFIWFAIRLRLTLAQ